MEQTSVCHFKYHSFSDTSLIAFLSQTESLIKILGYKMHLKYNSSLVMLSQLKIALVEY